MAKDKEKPKAKRKGASYTKKEVNLPNFFDNAVPTVFEGGLDRMIKIWNDLRKKNTGAYGSGVCSMVDGWGRWDKKADTVTACSPFTANVIGILFDPNGTAEGKSSPMFTTNDGKKPLPVEFYFMHQGNYKGPLPKGVSKNDVNHSAESILAYNLGYEIQPKDLRRGDMVGIDWSNNGGHAVFVWDVHTHKVGEYDETDAFSYISANGSIQVVYDPDDPPDPKNKYKSLKNPGKDRKVLYKNLKGPGISIGGCFGDKYLTQAKYVWKVPTRERPDSFKMEPKSIDGAAFFADRKEHIWDASWYAIPTKSASEIDMTTWKEGGPRSKIIDSSSGRTYVRSLRAVRLWGFPPPERQPDTTREGTDFATARTLLKHKAAPSFATGTGPAPKPTMEAVQPSETKADDVKAIKDAPPKKAEQPKKQEHYTKQQMWVERALGALFDHGWLDTDPGDRDNPNDAESKKAIKEFQEKMKLPATSVADKKTRDKMEEAVKDATAGELPPWQQPPPAPKTKLDRIVWLRNRVPPGGAVYFSVHGIVSKLTRLDITFKDRKSSKTVTMPCDVETDAAGVLERPIGIPKEFTVGAELLATFAGKASDGVAVKFESKVPLYIGPTPTALALE